MANCNLIAPIKVALAVHHHKITIIKGFFDEISQLSWGSVWIVNRYLTPDLVIIQIHRLTRRVAGVIALMCGSKLSRPFSTKFRGQARIPISMTKCVGMSAVGWPAISYIILIISR